MELPSSHAGDFLLFLNKSPYLNKIATITNINILFHSAQHIQTTFLLTGIYLFSCHIECPLFLATKILDSIHQTKRTSRSNTCTIRQRLGWSLLQGQTLSPLPVLAVCSRGRCKATSPLCCWDPELRGDPCQSKTEVECCWDIEMALLEIVPKDIHFVLFHGLCWKVGWYGSYTCIFF